MAIATIPGQFVFPRHPNGYTAAPDVSATLMVIDATLEAGGFIVSVPKTGNIRKIGWLTATVTTGATLDIRLETLLTGFPSGILWATNTNGAQVVANGDDNTAFLTTLTADAAVTRGQLIGVVIKNPAVSFANMQIGCLADDFSAAGPFTALFTTSWAKLTTCAPILYFEYDDGTYGVPPGCWPVYNAISSNIINSTTTPDVVGVRFQFPFPVSISGAWFWCDVDGDCNVRLVTDAYHQVNQTGVLGSIAVGLADDAGLTNAQVQMRMFSADINLSANTNYRLIIEPSGASSVNVQDFNMLSLAAMQAYAAGENWHFTTAKDPTADGSWTNYNSGTFRVPFMGLLLNGFEAGGGGGLLTHPGMSGGMRA